MTKILYYLASYFLWFRFIPFFFKNINKYAFIKFYVKNFRHNPKLFKQWWFFEVTLFQKILIICFCIFTLIMGTLGYLAYKRRYSL